MDIKVGIRSHIYESGYDYYVRAGAVGITLSYLN